MDFHFKDEDVEFVVRPYQFEPQISQHVQDIPSDGESSDDYDSTDNACSENLPADLDEWYDDFHYFILYLLTNLLFL
jgi:hypothetical protein